MRLDCRHILVAALVAALGPAPAGAQIFAPARSSAPKQSAPQYAAYSLTDEVSQQPAPPVPPSSPSDRPGVRIEPSCDIGCSTPCGGGCSSCCDCCACRAGRWLSCWPCGCKLEDLGEACKLWEPCCEDSPWSAAGWLAVGYVWNPYRPADRFNGPMTWNDRANEGQMNELFYYIGRAANTEGCGFDWGARVDAIYGTSYRWNTSAGFETHWGNGQFYGLAVPQAYVEGAYNDLSVKFGRFYSPVGYYVIGTANNFFPILPYTFQYGEPFTHTGAYATYKYSDDLVLGGGITHGWDCTDNTGNPHAGGLATAAYTIDEQQSIAYVGVFGNEPNLSGVQPYAFNGVGYTARYLQTLVYSNKFSDDVTGVLQSDFGTQHDAVLPGQRASWYGVNGYLYWNQTCRLQWGLNLEWFRDDGGFRVGQVLPSFGSPNARGFARGPGFQSPGFDGSFYRFMFGPKYYFTPNIYGRAAFVADWYSGDRSAAGDNPFDDGQRTHQQVVVFDLIATF